MYNVVLVSSLQQSKSAIHVHTATLSPYRPLQSMSVLCSRCLLVMLYIQQRVCVNPLFQLISLLCVCIKSLQSCLTLCNPMGCSPPNSCPRDSPGKKYLPNPGIECTSLYISSFGRQVLYHQCLLESPYPPLTHPRNHKFICNSISPLQISSFVGFFQIPHISDITCYLSFCLNYFSQYENLQVQPCFCKWHYFVFLWP